jgi:phospholipid/cholesterol/gamma-HCH transport system substrate-binding protein
MTRARVVIAVVLVAVTGLGALRVRSHNSGDSMYHVDAVFDTARGLLPGGRVKIAGANVGVIDDISLTPGRKALVSMRIDKRFAPFRSDAHCSSRPQGLVGVADVNCQPGTPNGKPLPKGQLGNPTLPLASTSVPVSLTDFFEIWHAPVRDRLRILLNELGMALSGRGGQLNDLLLRANPSLDKARRALAIIAAQRKTIARSITDTNSAISQLAADRGATRRFISEAAGTAGLVARHDRALGAGIAGLPPLLRRSISTLDQLDALNRGSLPLVQNLHASAPALDRLASDTVPFAKLATPSVKALTPALKEGNATAKVLGPFVRGLERFSKPAVPAGQLQDELQSSLRDTGTYESLLKLMYVGTASTSRFDSVSHMDPSHLVASPCASYESSHDAACDYHWVKQHDAATRHTTRKRSARHRTASNAPANTPDRTPSAPSVSTPHPGLPPLPKLPPIPKLPPLPSVPPVPTPPGVPPADHLLDYLLGS